MTTEDSKDSKKKDSQKKFTPAVFIKDANTHFLSEILNRILKVRMALYGAPPERVSHIVNYFLENQFVEYQKLLFNILHKKFNVSEVSASLKEEFYQFVIHIEDEPIRQCFEGIISTNIAAKGVQPVRKLLENMREDGLGILRNFFQTSPSDPGTQRYIFCWDQLERLTVEKKTKHETVIRLMNQLPSSSNIFLMAVGLLLISYCVAFFSSLTYVVLTPLRYVLFLSKEEMKPIEKFIDRSDMMMDTLLKWGGVALVFISGLIKLKDKINYFNILSDENFDFIFQSHFYQFFFNKKIKDFREYPFIHSLIKPEVEVPVPASLSDKASSDASVYKQLAPQTVAVKERNAYYKLEKCNTGTYFHLDRDKHLNQEPDLLDAVETQINHDRAIHPEDHKHLGLIRNGAKQKKFEEPYRMKFLQGSKGRQCIAVRERSAMASDSEFAGTTCKRVLSPVRVVK